MSVLEPWVLAALPLVALPILIHLINQRRYQTLRWGAMMFLLAANRMSRGYARLRQWLILAFRTLAVLGLILALSRPLASGWLGLAGGGRADTTLILLDRSPSMQQRALGISRSKMQAGLDKLAGSLRLLRSARWVLIDSQDVTPRELEQPEALLTSPASTESSAAADLPEMLEVARNYIQANKTGRTEIWICSDLRSNDWNRDSGRWNALRTAFLEFPQSIRFHLLAYAEPAEENVAVRVLSAHREKTSSGAELVLSVLLTREGETPTSRIRVPVQIEIDGARSEVAVEIAGPRYELKDHRIPLDARQQRGWGRVSIAADTNPADNEAYFVYDDPAPRRTLIVCEDPAAARPLQLAASIAPSPNLSCSAEVLAPTQLNAVDWTQLALVLWQAPLPEEPLAETLDAYVERGGLLIFFPPRTPGSSSYRDARWNGWQSAASGVPVESWRGDEDLLAHALSGSGLPVGGLEVRRYCQLEGPLTKLAILQGGDALLARAATARGGVYFCSSTAAAADSSLAAEGIVLYVLVQRALARGAAALGNTRILTAGQTDFEVPPSYRVLASAGDVLSTEYSFQRGVYAGSERLLAVNRPPQEDQAEILRDDQVAELFTGLDFARVDDQADNFAAIVQEIWRLFLLLMMLALLMEAVLCLPKLVRPVGGHA